MIDINSSYLNRLAERFPHPGVELDMRCADVNETPLEGNAFDLVHAALLLEYVTWQPLIAPVAQTMTPGGVLSVVLQLPSLSSPAVTPTQFTSLQTLEALFHFVDGDALIVAAVDAGLALDRRGTEPLPSGKAFDVLRFTKDR